MFDILKDDLFVKNSKYLPGSRLQKVKYYAYIAQGDQSIKI